jgi:hypothetical protein
MPRQRVRALAQGRGDDGAVAVPLALRLAARIQERDWDDFTRDPTQLANGLRDLVDACGPDGVPVTTPEVLLDGGTDLLGSEQGVAALEATRRLRASMGDRVALVACLPGPAALPGGSDALLAAGKEFLAAGADVLVVLADHGPPLGTLANVARFHQALALGCCDAHGLPVVARVPLHAPLPTPGVVLTTEDLPRDTDVSVLEDWVDAVRGS